MFLFCDFIFFTFNWRDHIKSPLKLAQIHPSENVTLQSKNKSKVPQHHFHYYIKWFFWGGSFRSTSKIVAIYFLKCLSPALFQSHQIISVICDFFSLPKPNNTNVFIFSQCPILIPTESYINNIIWLFGLDFCLMVILIFIMSTWCESDVILGSNVNKY